jgi:hypothetical protein
MQALGMVALLAMVADKYGRAREEVSPTTSVVIYRWRI